MKHWCVWVWFTAGLFVACSSENQWLDTALNLAGDNRAELQKVLSALRSTLRKAAAYPIPATELC